MIAKYVTNTHEITDTYNQILVSVKNTKIKIEPSSDNHTKLVFFETKKQPHEFFIQNNTLTIKLAKRRWYNLLGIGIDRSAIKLWVPKPMLEAISIRATAGRVDICSVVCSGTIGIQTNTGKLNLENVSCRKLDSRGNHGAVSLHNVVAEESISVKQSTGKVLLTDCAAPEIFAKTKTANISGRLPSDMVFAVCTNTGKTEVPQPPIGEVIKGRCEIKTNTGNIKFE